MIHPFLVLKIPLHGLLDSLLKLQRWLPSEFLLQLSRVDGVTHIVTLSIGYVSYQIQVSTLRATEQSINSLDNHLDDVDVLPLVEAADVVCVSHLALMEDKVDGTCVVFHIEPVADVEALAVDGKRLAMADIVDEQGFRV